MAGREWIVDGLGLTDRGKLKGGESALTEGWLLTSLPGTTAPYRVDFAFFRNMFRGFTKGLRECDSTDSPLIC